MQTEGVYDQVKNKLVLGENISQTASFVVSGSVDVGIVALSLALSPNMKDKGRYTEIPSPDYPPIEQACVILRSSKNAAVARAFLDFVRTDAIKDLLRNYGFEVPASPQSKEAPKRIPVTEKPRTRARVLGQQVQIAFGYRTCLISAFTFSATFVGNGA
jgi:ABC-type Fe3+ transport system substrate-binding protein